jgi:hypothetical protein
MARAREAVNGLTRYGWIPCGLAIAAVGAAALAGCTMIRNYEANQKEQMLAAAGFTMKLADTPEKLAHLQTLAQRKLVPYPRNGKVYYLYADALSCKCLYVGDEKAYQRFQQLALEQRIADEEREAAAMNEQAAMNWGMWGPW